MNGAQVDKLIALAAADIGYKESPPNSNKTKYGKWYGMDGQPWCMMAVQYWFNQVGLSPLLYRTASCTALLNYAKQHGLFHTTDYQPGDLALFNWSGLKTPAQHIGIIERVGASYDSKTGIYTSNPSSVVCIEGNTSVGNDSDGGEVMRRTRSYSQIIGVYRPKYNESEDLTLSQYQELKAIIDAQAERIKTLEAALLPKYKTLGDVPAWGSEAVKDAIERKILTGVTENDLSISWNEARALTWALRRERGE